MISNTAILSNMCVIITSLQPPAQSSQFLSPCSLLSTTHMSHDYISSVRELSLTQLPVSIIPSFFILETKSHESLTPASCLDFASKVYPTTSKPTTQWKLFQASQNNRAVLSQGLCQVSPTTIFAPILPGQLVLLPK